MLHVRLLQMTNVCIVSVIEMGILHLEKEAIHRNWNVTFALSCA